MRSALVKLQAADFAAEYAASTGWANHVTPDSTLMMAPPVLMLRITPLTLTSTAMVVPTLTTAVSPAPGTPVGLQRVVVLQLNGRLPLVTV